MSNALLSSKVVIIEESPSILPVQPAPTSVTAALGITERGPVGQATLVQSFAEYLKIFGSYTADSDVALAAKGFFDGGGTFLWIVRTVHYSDNTSPNTKTSAAASGNILTSNLAAAAGFAVGSNAAPWTLAPGDTLIIKIDGAGSPPTATFNATSAHVDTTGSGPYTLANNMTLTLKFDNGHGVLGTTQTVTFTTAQFADITNATAIEVANAINAAITHGSASVVGGKVRLTSDTIGTGAKVQVTGGTANTPLVFGTSEVDGTGNVSDITAVTIAEFISIVNAAITTAGTASDAGGGIPKIASATTGSSSSVQLTGGTARTKFGFDSLVHIGNNTGTLTTLQAAGKWDGTYGNDLTIAIASATSGDATFFNLSVLENGSIVETFPNGTMDPTDPDYIVDMVNDPNTGSDLIELTDAFAATSAPNNRPANGSTSLSGGNDGLSGLVDADFIGSQVANAAAGTGLRAFDSVPDLGILTVPARATATVHNAMVNYCEATRFGSIFAVLDPPEGQSAQQMVTYVTQTALLKELSEFAAIYWPRVTIANPNTTVFGSGATITVAPSGWIAGRYAANDNAKPGGVYEAPAGVDFGRLTNVVGLENDEAKDENKRDLVSSALINPIVGLTNLPIHMDGCATLKTTGPFPTIGERRGVIFIEQSLKSSLVFAKHRKIKPSLLNQLFRTVRAFLLVQMRNDAFATNDPDTAFLIDFGPGLNPPTEAFARRVNGRISLATAKPAEYIVLRVGQDTRALEAELAAAA